MSDEIKTAEAAIAALKAKFDAGVTLNEFVEALPEIYKVFPPTVYFITAFTDGYMEMQRAFNGARPKKPEAELDTETGLFRIVRERDDGTKLYYLSTLGKGIWYRSERSGEYTNEQAEKELEFIERIGGRHGYYSERDTRTFGYYFDEATAIQAAEGNWMDMHEMKYTWLVIEPYGGHGIHPFLTEGFDKDTTIWFRWKEGEDESKMNGGGKWVRHERPPETKQTIGYAVG